MKPTIHLLDACTNAATETCCPERSLATLSAAELLTRRRSLRRKLRERKDLQPLRVAVLGGGTTQELVDVLELLLLDAGWLPEFYQGAFGQFYEEAVLDVGGLQTFAPKLCYLFLTVRDLRFAPGPAADEADLAEAVEAELARLRETWRGLTRNIASTGCQVIQNNFEQPALAPLGSLEAVAPGGLARFVQEVNAGIAREANRMPRLTVLDLHGLAAWLGSDRWFDLERWFAFKLPLQPEATVALARALTAQIRALLGRARKVLVLDLDNTLWGGVLGDDGVDGLRLGRETPLAEAFTAFGEYCLQLRSRGVLLAVCSKNDEAVALAGLMHPDAVVRREHLAAIRANWEPKPDNLRSIAEELNLGLDSLVFADDNPAERSLVRSVLPEVAVPELGDHPARFPGILDAGRYFETAAISADDLRRAEAYQVNACRRASAGSFADYGAFLHSLEMTAEIARFAPVYVPRITQLTNKTNQFNLTGRRYTCAELASAMDDPDALGLYGKLSDRFGDNGLVSIILGRRAASDLGALRLDLWLMSCRVLKREMELAMLDALAAGASAEGYGSLLGVYVPTGRNGMVAEHYARLGFVLEDADEPLPSAATLWRLDLAGYEPRSRHVAVIAPVLAEHEPAALLAG